MELGTAIRLCRERKKITRSTLAKRASLSVSYISLLENNKRDPNSSKIQKIADVLDIPIPIILFLATKKSEFESISPELAEKLSLLTFKVLEGAYA